MFIRPSRRNVRLVFSENQAQSITELADCSKVSVRVQGSGSAFSRFRATDKLNVFFFNTTIKPRLFTRPLLLRAVVSSVVRDDFFKRFEDAGNRSGLRRFIWGCCFALFSKLLLFATAQ